MSEQPQQSSTTEVAPTSSPGTAFEPAPDGRGSSELSTFVRSFPAERAKAFIDAVVAIAMTLLILPLMESVSELGAEHPTTEGGRSPVLVWLGEHDQQLVSFAISFAVIALFWIGHHQMFSRVHRITPRMLWLVMPWLLSIVWLPVATALSGQVDDRDNLVKVVYIGSMVVTYLFSLLVRWYVIRHPEVHSWDGDQLRGGTLSEMAVTIMFAVCAVVATLVPGLGYGAMFLMFLAGPLAALARRLGRGISVPDGTAEEE